VDLEFWLLDITYSVVGGTPEVRMFGVSKGGERVVVTDRGFRPYFYVKGKPSNLRQALAKIAPIEAVDVVERRYFGRPVELFKVTARVPDDVRRLREPPLP
jgi:replicative DNA polymerase I (EC 2.7.7.7)